MSGCEWSVSAPSACTWKKGITDQAAKLNGTGSERGGGVGEVGAKDRLIGNDNRWLQSGLQVTALFH